MKGINKSKLLCLIVLLFGFVFNFQNIYASDIINFPEQVDFTISYIDGSHKIQGVEFNIYKIGDIDKNNNISLCEEFKKYPIEDNKSIRTQWNDYANTLKGYVKKDNVKALYKGKTDKNGLLNTKLQKGLYLIVGEVLITENHKYVTNPFIVMLPELDKESGKYLNKTTAYPKFTKEKNLKNKINIDVLKVWDDDGYENKRPSFIEVELLANGKPKENVKLNKKNNWTYVWKNLDSSVSWTVVEKNVNKEIYRVKVTNYENSFVITNIYIPSYTTPKNPPKKPPMIPQTGQSWLPVYLLSGLGIVSIGIGYVKEKRKEGESCEK
ncbi:Cna B-type domain-containing protein [Peptoniphilus asaccharolyticus]